MPVQASVARWARSLRRSTSTLRAPGRKARITRPSSLVVRPEHAEGIGVEPVGEGMHRTWVEPPARSELQLRHGGAPSSFSLNSRREADQTCKRNADPGRAVGRFVSHFIGCFFDQKKIQ